MNRWFVVHCHPNGEQKALFHLRRQGYETYLPSYKKTRRHSRRLEQISRPLFPRYLFVKLDLEYCCWRPIRSTIGVSQLICRGDLPAAVPEGIVEELQSQENEKGLVVPGWDFQEGDRVQVTDGALLNQIGLFKMVDGGQRVVILLNLLGREVKVGLPMEDVQACA